LADQVEVSNPKLIEGCKFWDKITRELHTAKAMAVQLGFDLDLSNLRPPSSEIYSDRDYEPLACRIDGEKAEMTVGSSPGHTTHILLDRGEIHYYDTDRIVNGVMKQLLEEEANVKCAVVEGGVDCEGLKSEVGDPQRGYLPQLKALFRVLAMPTSMDIRHDFCREIVGNTEEYCIKRERDLFKQVKKAYPE